MPKPLEAIARVVARILDAELGKVKAQLQVHDTQLQDRIGDLVTRMAVLTDRIERSEGGNQETGRTSQELRESLAEIRGRVGALSGLVGVPGPAGPVGPAGSDGRDGSLERLDVSMEPTEDPRRFVFIMRAASGLESRTEFTVPTVIYQGIWQAGMSYKRGDCITHDGSSWVALDDTAARPGTDQGRIAWRLAVKRGRDAREIAA